MGLICLLAAHLLQCWSNLSLHLESGLLLLCFYIALWLWQFLWVVRRWVVFAPSSLCVWSQRLWRSLQIILLCQGFLHIHLLEFGSLNLWCHGLISLKAILVLIYLIIVRSCCLQRFPWLSFTICPYNLLLLAGLLDYTCVRTELFYVSSYWSVSSGTSLYKSP